MASLSAADAASVPVPDIIKQFVVYLYRHIRYGDIIRALPSLSPYFEEKRERRRGEKRGELSRPEFRSSIPAQPSSLSSIARSINRPSPHPPLASPSLPLSTPTVTPIQPNNHSERNVPEIASMVDTSFSRLTERLYRSTPWPPAAAIAPLVDGDAVFLLLYKELTFRHLHACCAGLVTLRDRAASWDNYRALFDIVLNANLNVRLPPSWLWDVVDEFCYQFQAFHQARSRAEASLAQGGGGGGGGSGKGGGGGGVSSLDAAELQGPAGAAWPAAEVSRYLSDLASRAALDDAALSSAAGAAAFAASDGGSGPDGKGSNVLRLLGLFSRLGLARVRCCLGDYQGSLEALGPALNPMMLSSSASSASASSAAAEASTSSGSSSSSAVSAATAAALAAVVPNRHLYTLKVAGAHVCLHYYAGFSYLMLGRYVDACRTLDAALAHVARVKQFHARSQGYDALLKKNEQCAALLALALALCPGAAGGGSGSSGGSGFSSAAVAAAAASSSSRLSDAAASALREKHADKVARMSRSAHDASWEDLFAYGCPKFVPTESSAAAASAASGGGESGGGENNNNANAAQAAYRAQLRAFLGVVASRRHLPPLRQLLRIYTKASLPKLTALMNSASAAASAASASSGGASASTDPNAQPLSVDELREALHQLIAAQTCVTWCGPAGSGPEAGTPLAGCAVDVELELSTDAATGEELVEVLLSSESGAEGNSANSPAELAAGVEALARQIDAISGVVRDLAALPPLVV